MNFEAFKGQVVISISAIFGLIDFQIVKLSDPAFVSLLQGYVSMIGIIAGIIIGIYNAFFKK